MIDLCTGGLQFRIHLPEKAESRVEGSAYFLCKLTDVKTFSLHPFRNASTTIQSLAQIQQLGLIIDNAAAAEGGLVKVWCRMGEGSADARLGIVATQFHVWDEAFDQVSPEELV